jgi:hypothetical protein
MLSPGCGRYGTGTAGGGTGGSSERGIGTPPPPEVPNLPGRTAAIPVAPGRVCCSRLPLLAVLPRALEERPWPTGERPLALLLL